MSEKKPRAWIRPLKSGTYQWFVTTSDSWGMGTANSYFKAREQIKDIASADGFPLLGIRHIRPLGKWWKREGVAPSLEGEPR